MRRSAARHAEIHALVLLVVGTEVGPSDAIVIDSPMLISPTFVFQISCPVGASSAIVWLSSVLKKIRPSE